MSRLTMAIAAFCLLWTGAHSPAQAHEFDPHIVQLNERAQNTYAVRWTAPVETQATLVWPTNCTQTLVRQEGLTRWFQAQCQTPAPNNAALSPQGLPNPNDHVLLDVRRLDGKHWQHLLRGQDSQLALATLSKSTQTWEIARAYLGLGVEHLLFGFDHLLFVLGLLALIRVRRALIAAATAFTLGHALTLCLATLGWVTLSPGPVEACIALSLVWMAREMALRGPQDDHTQRADAHRPFWLAAGGFGLLHGLGFAGALSELGLPQSQAPLALAAFNIGIEVAQLIVIALGLLIAAATARWKGRERLWRLAPYAMGAVAMGWFYTRTLSVLTAH